MEQVTPSNIPPEYPPQIDQTNEVHRQSIKEMGQNLYADLNQLWIRESQLVRTELNEKIGDVKAASSSLTIGGVLLFVGLLCLVATLIIAMDIYVQLWVASTVMTLIVLIFGGILFQSGKKKLEVSKLKPKHSIDALSDIKNTFQEKIHEFQKH